MSSLHENKPSVMDIFVNRPVLAIVLSILIILAGVSASKSISVQQYPKIESASLVINTGDCSDNINIFLKNYQ